MKYLFILYTGNQQSVSVAIKNKMRENIYKRTQNRAGKLYRKFNWNFNIA